MYSFMSFQCLIRNRSFFDWKTKLAKSIHCQSINSIAIKAIWILYLKFSSDLFTSREDLFIDQRVAYKLSIAAEKSLRESTCQSRCTCQHQEIFDDKITKPSNTECHNNELKLFIMPKLRSHFYIKQFKQVHNESWPKEPLENGLVMKKNHPQYRDRKTVRK